jgi:tripartite-type tricarboxylate transporter receptor subunit TctC
MIEENPTMRFVRCVSACVVAAALTSGGAATAQTYPSKAVRVIVPFTPGGISDVLARVMSQHLTSAMGQQFVVDNRPGAGTTIAGDLVAKSPPDGYTVYFIDMTTHAINATLYSKLPYDSVKDFTQVAMVAQTPLVMVVHPSLPVKNVKELIAFAKARPDEVSYGSSGNGTILHLTGETIKTMAGVKMVHVPYKGSAPAVSAVLGGEIAVTFGTTPAAIPQVQAGKLRALGVTTPKRSPALPDVPAIGETLKGFDIVLYSGVMGPAGMSRDTVARLSKELARMVTLPNIKDAWAKQGADPITMTPEETTAHLQSDIQKLGKLVKAAGAKID